MTTATRRNRLVIGLGTGRCGTQSLANLLDRQHGANVTHERVYQNIKWQGSEPTILEWLDALEEGGETGLQGDVASYYLSYVEFILARVPGARFVCLKRPREETVDSFMRITAGKNHWIDHGGNGWKKSMWDDSFPSFEETDKEQALLRYWNEYYEDADRLQDVFPQNFRIFHTDFLNETEGQRSILSFAGIPASRQILKAGIRLNTEADRERHARKVARQEKRQALLKKFRNWTS